MDTIFVVITEYTSKKINYGTEEVIVFKNITLINSGTVLTHAFSTPKTSVMSFIC